MVPDQNGRNHEKAQPAASRAKDNKFADDEMSRLKTEHRITSLLEGADCGGSSASTGAAAPVRATFSTGDGN